MAQTKRAMLDAVIDGSCFCWLPYQRGDAVLYNVWLRWQVRGLTVTQEN
jgi:hypothetical protein